MIAVLKNSRLRGTIILLMLLGGAGDVRAAEPWTAPHGDINYDGAIVASDLQCQVLLFERLAEVGEPGEDLCATDADCQVLFGAGNYCRPGFAGFNLCLPTCISPQVSLGESTDVDCSANDEVVDTPDCLGKVQKRNADLDCDGQLTITDLNFLVAVIMEKAGGPGTCDHDSDGRLNFCDDDSDGDGDLDKTDCAVLDSSRGGTLPEHCDMLDNNCNLLVDGDDPELVLDQPCENQQGVCQGSTKPAPLCFQGTWLACSVLDYGGHSPAWQQVENLCDGKDNDCNGLADDLVPDFDQDGINDCLDDDDDNDGDPDLSDCAPENPNIGHGQSEVCFNNVDDDCNQGTPDVCVLGSCRTLHATNPNLSSGLYTVDPDGNGSMGSVQVYCDMSTDGGGWTLVYRGTNTAGTNESPVVSNGNSIGQTPIQPNSVGHHKLSDSVINQLRSGAVNNDIRFEVYIEDSLLGRSYHNKGCVLQSGSKLAGSHICNQSTTAGPDGVSLIASGHVGSLTRWYNDSNLGYIWGGIGTHVGPMPGGSSIGGLKPHTYCTWYDSRVCPKNTAIMIWVN